jgi:flavodoxin
MGTEPVKRWGIGLLTLVMLCFAAACSSPESGDSSMPETYFSEAITETGPADKTDGQQVSEHNKILIAYFTWANNVENTSEVDATTSASVQPPGNVAQMAAWIQHEIGGELFSIQVEEPYPADYDACLDRAADEKAENARPKLTEKVSDISEYDTVFLGYPNWWYSAPMAVFSFLEENDLSGKKVVLFCSHGTGGLASSVKDISDVLSKSQIESNVLGVYRDDISQSQKTIQSWLDEIGY